jgi:hypothetical protein
MRPLTAVGRLIQYCLLIYVLDFPASIGAHGVLLTRDSRARMLFFIPISTHLEVFSGVCSKFRLNGFNKLRQRYLPFPVSSSHVYIKIKNTTKPRFFGEVLRAVPPGQARKKRDTGLKDRAGQLLKPLGVGGNLSCILSMFFFRFVSCIYQ